MVDRGAHRMRLLLVLVLAVALGHAAASPAATGPPAAVGRWGDVLQWPLQAKHMMLLHTGKVLVWASQANADPHLWDPVADPTGANMKPVPFAFGDLHCAAQVELADGRVLIVGGQNVNTHIGIPVTAIFDPVTETWTRGADMHFARWYPTLTLMADGRVLVASGDQGTTVRITTPEIYDPSTDHWTDAAKPVSEQYLYPFMYQLPGGTVFEAGTRTQTQFFDPFGGSGGMGSWAAGRVAPFNTDSYSESGAMYAPGKIIRAGGGDPAQAQTAVIDTNVTDPTKAQWRLTAPMNHPRRRMNLPITLDGRLLAVGGTAVGNNPGQAVKSAEIWDPATERWTEVADMAEPRMYHSTALTLPDGRVVSAGGQVTLDGATEDDPSSTSLQLTAQIFEPPYLFTEAQRPSIVTAPSQSAYDATLGLTLGDTRSIAKVGLLRPSGVTHAIDMNQRYVPLDFTQAGAQITTVTPKSPYRAVPGWYMLVVTDSAGVPSIARWILLGSGQAVQDPGAPAPIAPAAPVPATASITPMSPTTIRAGDIVSFASSWTGPPTSFAWTFGDGTTSGAAHPSHRFNAPGVYTVGLTVKNSLTAGYAATPVTVTVLGDGAGGADPGGGTPAPPPASGDSPPAPGAPSVPADPAPPAEPTDAAGEAPRRRTFAAVATGSVSSLRPTTAIAGLQVRQGPGAGGDRRRAFLRFDVQGLSSAPERAVLRLHVADASADGGSVFTTAGSWPAGGPSWNAAPAVAGTSVASAGATTAGRWIALDVTRAVTGNGTIGLALLSTSADPAAYDVSGAGAPELVVTSRAQPGAPPSADFAAAPRHGTGTLTAAFVDRSVGATSWAWDFDGDGHVDATDRNPRHTYREPGTYTVRLTARNAAGSDVAVQERLIVVDRARPVRRFAPVADATIVSTAPRRGTASGALGVRQGDAATPRTSRSYLKFRLTGLRSAPPSATLRLFVRRGGSDGGSVSPVGSRWTEGGLAWSTAPGLTGPSVASAGPVLDGTWIDLDVTRAVTGNGTVSLALATTTADAIAYAGREDAAHRPQLVVSTTGGSSARRAAVRRAHLASLQAAHPSLVCPLDAGL